ncbi:porin [Mesosutterella sp. AGMB02718]|uniref:Porin n=1 Tax=Mesosutterella faecium TaxID=2925194 RepID=A0ABT7IR03_9BURK|nr:porin [Mesosutterella sp. AGMB02718]MDL2059702.1 porin [Mesosutterella sp. AGMB02718]
MKKTLLAAAMLAAFSGAASAASVTLYGTIDTGLQYQHQKADGMDSTNTVSMETGQKDTSLWGLTGTEKIGDAEVSFKLENSYNSDDGTRTDDRLFDREAQVSVSGRYGTLSAGRLGALSAAVGTYDMVYLVGDAYDGGDGDAFGLAAAPTLDNALVYQTPSFAGFKATLMYSFNADQVSNSSRENTSMVDRYFGGALNYEKGHFQAVLAYEYLNRASAGDAASPLSKNGQLVNLGFNYNFENVAQVFLLGQYFKGWDLSAAGGESLTDAYGVDADDVLGSYDKGLEGWGAHLGAIFPVAGGDLTGALYYVDSKAKSTQGLKDADLTYFGASVRYAYPLSKRTSVYAGARYSQAKAKDFGAKLQTTSVYTGLSHSF